MLIKEIANIIFCSFLETQIKKLVCSCHLNFISTVLAPFLKLTMTSKRKLSLSLIQNTLFLILLCSWNHTSHWLVWVSPQREICFYKMQFKQWLKLYTPPNPTMYNESLGFPRYFPYKKNWTKENKTSFMLYNLIYFSKKTDFIKVSLYLSYYVHF